MMMMMMMRVREHNGDGVLSVQHWMILLLVLFDGGKK
jgi:hypothetical protein